MKIFSIFAKPSDPLSEQAVFISESFSWSAFAFTFLWAFWHRMWSVGFILLALTLVVFMLPRPWNIGADIMVGLVTAIFSAEIRQWWLRLKGYEQVGQVPARKTAEAEIRFFSTMKLPDMWSQPAQPITASTTDTLGLFSKPV